MDKFAHPKRKRNLISSNVIFLEHLLERNIDIFLGLNFDKARNRIKTLLI